MRENKGTYQNKGTFASCKGSAKDLQPGAITLYLVAIGCNLLHVSDHLQLFRLPRIISRCYYRYYYVCLCHLLQIYSNISTMEKPLSAVTMGIYISAVTGCK